MTPSPNPTNAQLGFRVDQIEREIKEVKAAQRELRSHLDERFDRLDGRVESLAFVRRDVYDADQRLVTDRIESVKATADGARTVAIWCIGLLVSLVALGIVGLVQVAA